MRDTIDGRQAPRRAASGRLARNTERDERTFFINVPALEAQSLFVLETGRLAFFDDQWANQPATEFFAAVHVRVIPIAAGIRHAEFVIEVFTRQHRQLRHVGHAIHFQWQTDAMPVNGGRHRQVIDETHPQPFTLTNPQLGARRRWAERPGFGLVPGHQFDVQRRGDQLIVVARIGIGHLAQPVPRRAPHTDANDNKTGQATEDLATGKGHELNYLTYQRQVRRPAKGEYDTPADEKQ
ncbi:hypothetical protein EMIT0P171_120040 [Pseudomonas sp. IT-P171]